jgi:hypothetical protein
MSNSLQRVLWPQEDFAELFDEFAVRGCRVHFRRGWITVEALSAEADTAAVLSIYAAALKKRLGWTRLLTVEAFAALPPRPIHTVATGREAGWIWKGRCRRLGHARRDIVAPAHPRLSQCYDYFQSANDDHTRALFDLYKMIETIEDQYGGEKKAQDALGPELMKTLKRMANDSRSPHGHDQRHASKIPGTATPPTANELSQAIEDGRALLRTFEEDVIGRAC